MSALNTKEIQAPSYTIASCIFCGARRNDNAAYKMSGYNLYSCRLCNTVSVGEMPTDDELKEYYIGFKFQLNKNCYYKIINENFKRWMKSCINSQKRTSYMLDVGGGGGFFAKAFEDFNLGRSTYIDIDPYACDFAKNQMNLKFVICDSVENIEKHTGNKKYDFIYCRHVVEHLKNPIDLIIKCAKLLTPMGTLIVQCPNGTSKEGIFYPDYWFKFLNRIKKENKWNLFYALYFSLTKNYGWGIDPIRHLWAISSKGIYKYFEHNKKFNVKISTASLADPVFSPYWVPSRKRHKIISLVSRYFYSKIFEGMHLIIEIKRNDCSTINVNNNI